MTDPLVFTVPGDPRGKGRPRASMRFGRATLYTDDKTASYENLVALCARQALAGRAPLDVPLCLTMLITITPPASTSNKQRAAMLADVVLPTKKPDLDNVVKAVMDGCNAVAFRDDVLVTDLIVRKRYGAVAGVHVRLTAASAVVDDTAAEMAA